MTARLSVHALSGFDEKGPACVRVQSRDRQWLLDLGHGPDPGREPPTDALGAVDAVLLSHGHRDHAGALHRRAHLGLPPVWCTDAVARMLPAGTPCHRLPLRGEVEVQGLRVRTGRNGHAPGGVWLHLDDGHERLLYCGDCSRESPVYAFDPPPPADLVLCDASYGDYDTALPSAADALLRALAPEGGVPADADALLPVPAGGRGPEIAWWLVRRAGLRAERLQLGAELRAAITAVATSPASRHSLAAGVAEDLCEIASAAGSVSDAPGVRLAAGADGASGEAAALIERFTHRAVVRIVFTGYLPVGTPARALVDQGRALYRRWNVHPRRQDNADLVASCGARAVLPLFGRLDALPRFAGDIAPAILLRSPRWGAAR